MKATHIRNATFWNRKERSTRPIWPMTVWWLTQMIPIVRKLTAYATYDGQTWRSSWPRRCPLPLTWESTLRISSVAAIAKTPSAKVSRRPRLMAPEARAGPVRLGWPSEGSS